jgi:hypothetical protein
LPAPLDTVTITPASLISVIGAENYLAVKLLDQFGNLIKGSVSSVTAEVVAGRAIFSDSNTSTSTKQTVDGMLVFPFSSNTVGEVTIKISARS